jgi:hypothetical protein
MRRRSSSQRSPARTSDTGGSLEIHGRAGESLPVREKTRLGNEPDWDRNVPESPAQKVSPSRRKLSARTPTGRVIEIEYERGPGSRFQVEGRGAGQNRKRKRKPR